MHVFAVLALLIHHAVSSNSAAQAAFDRGLLDYYAYNPEAAQHEFYTAADLDPHLAMAYWGIAISNAPNLNVSPTDDRDHQASAAIGQAKALERYASPEDAALIDAAIARFGGDPSSSTRSAKLAAYRDALLGISQRYPDDPDAAALYAEAALYVVVDRMPAPYDKLTDPQRADLLASANALLPFYERNIAKFPNHVGLLHFYIHAAQTAQASDKAVDAAKRLASFEFPNEDSHLTHMPGHTFFDVGLYDDAYAVGKRSLAMDAADIDCCHPGYYSSTRYYHDHNVIFALYAMTQTGHFTEAIATARGDDNPLFVATSLVAAKQWNDVIAIPNPTHGLTFDFTRGLAYAKLGDILHARELLADFPTASTDPFAKALHESMRLTLSAEIALAQHDDMQALQLLRDACTQANIAQKLGQPEYPPLYYYSPHLALAQLATRLGKTDLAQQAYRDELSASPRSSAALSGLAQLGER